MLGPAFPAAEAHVGLGITVTKRIATVYTLLVGGEVPEGDEGTFVLVGDRYLEYTADTITPLFSALSTEAEACLLAWPCLRMAEGRGAETAQLAKVSAINRYGRDYSIGLRYLPLEPSLINEIIWRERGPLDIEQFEFSRHHWAIKQPDLLGLLKAIGHTMPVEVDRLFRNLPPPAVTREELLQARDALSERSQTDIDDLLLEAGVDGLDVPRSLGSRRDRSNAIIKFALKNPSILTASRSLFSAFIVKRVLGGAVAKSTDQSDAAIGLPPSTAHTAAPYKRVSRREPNRVFLVHGRNDDARKEVVALIERHGLEAIVLHEQPNMGRHLLTKFIDEAGLVTFAVVLMTDDDEGRRCGESKDLAPRARQNVVLELGYFLAHLGQERVCALKTPSLETPSDFDGIAYIALDKEGNWQRELLRELRAAGLPLPL